MSKDIIIEEANYPPSIYGGRELYGEQKARATILSQTSLVPKTFANNIPNCMIALEMAARMRMPVMAVVQNMHIIDQRPSWSSTFLIALLSNKFESHEFKMLGSINTDSWGCRFVATRNNGEEIIGPLVTIGMARSEGWLEKKGSKWKTMPELMLSYRAASFFARLHAAEYVMGMFTEDEVLDTVMIPEEKTGDELTHALVASDNTLE